MKWPEEFRYQGPHQDWATQPGDPFGWFAIPPARFHETAYGLQIIATDGRCGQDQDTGWEHVSVSRILKRQRPPNWAEMCLVKSLFWEDEACVIQFHPLQSDYINLHPGVLHLWRPRDGVFPMPPKICV